MSRHVSCRPRLNGSLLAGLGSAAAVCDCLHMNETATSWNFDMDGQEREIRLRDRRKSVRFPIYAPATAILGDREIRGFTRDLSSTGAYLSIDANEELPWMDHAVDLVIRIPPSMRLSSPCFLTCRGRTVRGVTNASGEAGFAVEVSDIAIGNGLPNSIWKRS